MPEAHILRPPYYKGKNYSAAPVAKYGVPKEADSRINPKCIGTPFWENYWNEQIFYCINGFQTGGLFIPGRMYYYLNFNTMATVTGMIAPDMVDLHLELAYLIDYAKANKMNIICAKKRRAGISEFTQKAVIDYGFRFTNGAYQAGIAAGAEIYAQDLIKKWKANEALLNPELRIKKLKDNADEIIAGYKVKNDAGELVEGGTKNTIYIATMGRNPALFKGKFLNDVIAEECGEFDKLQAFYAHTLPCIMDGSRQVGTMFFYGTGGNMNKGGKEFETMWEEADNNNFIRFLIPATRFHKPYYGGYSEDGAPAAQIPNLLKTKRPHELIGTEDLLAAEENILKKRNEILRSRNMKKYQEHLRDYPLTKEDIFAISVNNDFDGEILNDQRNAINSRMNNYFRCQLDWVKNDEGEIKMPLEVELRYDNAISEDDCCILIHKDHTVPLKGWGKLYCAGIDSYDQDRAKTSKSKGAMCVLIRRNDMPGAMQLAPVATICVRPPRKEIFYEMCLKLAIYFDLKESVLIDVANKLIFEYFEDRGYQSCLAYRPKKFETENSQQTNVYGIHLNNYSKPLMVGIMQSAIIDYGTQIWFPQLITQLSNYNEVAIGSDNDLADAYGIALMQNSNESVPARNNSEYDNKDVFQLSEWSTDAYGNKVPVIANAPKIISLEQDVPGRFLSL